MLAQAYAAAGQHKTALASYDRLARLAPKSAKPLADKALLLQQMGDMQAADEALRRALRLSPLNGSLLRMLTAAKTPPDDPIVARFKEAWEKQQLSAADRIEAGFGLAKVFGAQGWDYLNEANALQRAAAPWKIADRDAEVTGLLRAMGSGPWPEAPAPAADRRPIFVTGMPRSGTTLLEQILSGHADVQGTGETGLPLRACYSVLVQNGGFRDVSGLTGAELATIGQRYLDGMERFHQATGVFTDKSINTYMIMGLLHHILPQARVIVVRRDPRDIGLSIYRNFFATGTHGYSNDLADIARYVATMERCVEHWHAARPEAFLEVRYEDLVTDPEPAIRGMLDYCGLDWDPACLTPEKNLGAVKTLSVDQVRSPINPNSVGGWKRHAAALSPLLETLGELTAPWD
ncbi:TPR repeat domain protein [Candidatus Rhodobacter oscarellae]|uniref:TPR repeat domain protein n=1 Tax=Candidatus Rhodobacter oscarellae TaxID=1675527 RepID=A0A0J9E7F3_9RHOB|nr:TPR repeat domain protein [Candidatus Rhodobacter lobularis]